MINQNSFSDNIANLTKNANIAIETLNAVTESIIGDDAVVSVQLPNNESVNILSTNNIINRLENVENTVKSFTSGAGTVKLVDGTHRSIKVTTIPQTPNKIKDLEKINKFDINHNWFFEEFMFPRLVVKYDLKDKIDDTSDRIKVCRIIINLTNSNKNNIKAFYLDNIENKNLSYNELINLLNYNNIQYYEDIETLDFPLYENDYFGKFTITKSEIINGNLYYYLDTLYMSSKNTTNSNIKLEIGNRLKFNQSIYEIIDINDTYNRIDVKREIGLDSIGVGESFEYYNDPFKAKIIEIPIGMNEINCIFLKGINESYNLIADEWSDMISFITNDLLYEYDKTTLEDYYNKYVSDFGKDLIAQIKEQRILAYNGITPNPVVLNKNDFRVVKINTQVNAALNTDEVKNTQANIVSLKSNIDNLKRTIAAQKSNLLTNNNSDLENQIKTNINKLQSLSAEYTSTVEYLNTYLNENGIVISKPKYHIRGFFNIPEYQYVDPDKKIGKQEIIGFDIRYRYLKMNEVGTELSTFNYLDSDGNTISAVYSDWNIHQTLVKDKKYNNDTGLFEWLVENPADGNQININQVDIPISNGEKVEFMVRSISEAGYPNNPLKSEWSNSIIMEFPENLESTDQFENILNDVKSEMTSIRLNDTLSSAGYYTHIDDEIISKTDENVIYRHNANNIGFMDKDDNKYISLYSKIIALENRIKELEAQKTK